MSDPEIVTVSNSRSPMRDLSADIARKDELLALADKQIAMAVADKEWSTGYGPKPDGEFDCDAARALRDRIKKELGGEDAVD